MANQKLLIAVPTFENCSTETFKSIYGLQRPTGFDLLCDMVKGYDCAKGRNVICQEALDYNFDWLLMVDSDMVLPNHTLVSLLSHNQPIVFGWYPRRCTSMKNISLQQTELFRPGMRDFTDANNIKINEIPATGLTEIKGGGMGCALIKCSILQDLKDQSGLWFKYVQYSQNSVLSEDNYFCCRATEAGYKIFADNSVRCGHICKIVI